MKLARSTEWEGERVRLVRLGGLPRGPLFPWGWEGKNGPEYRVDRRRNVQAVIVHQLGGGFDGGEAAAVKYAEHCSESPRISMRDGDDAMVHTGGGRGLPGAACTFLVPFHPETVDGRLEVHRLWTDEWIVQHTDDDWDARSVSVGFVGSLDTRHAPRFTGDTGRDPEPTQFVAGTELIQQYLLPRYGQRTALMGHFEIGRPHSPGDVLEAWIRRRRRETVNWLAPGRAPWDERDPLIEGRPREARTELDTWEQRQQVLKALGFRPGLGGVHDYATRIAVEGFQAEAGLVVSGFWDDEVETHVRRALAAAT